MPKNMKLGNAARGTNPLDPVYKLPASKSPRPLEPKFLRDNINVDDIAGARPRQRIKINVETVSASEPLDGSFSGWKPSHRRRFGKTVRDLCLKVEDINKPLIRMIRSPNSEAYLQIEGSNSKSLKQFRVRKSQKNPNLQSQYIEDVDEYQKIYEVESSDQSLETLKGIAKDLAKVFTKMDRDKSGKLTLGEVQIALKKLQLDLTPVEFKSLSSVFVSGMDGYIDYPKLLRTLSPSPCADHMNRYNPNKLDSHAIALCLNPYTDRPWTIGCIKSGDSKNEESKQKLDSESEIIDIRPCTVGMNIESGKSTEELSICSSAGDSQTQLEGQLPLEKGTKHESYVHIDRKPGNVIVPLDIQDKNQIPKTVLMEDKKFPFQFGLAFWPEEKTLHTQENARFRLSLPQDYKEAPQYPLKPLTDDEKLWETNVGGTAFTGEGNIVNSGSYMHGSDWCRSSVTKTLSKKRTSGGQVQGQRQALTNIMCVPQIDTRTSTARTDITSLPTAKRRPVSASVAQYYRKLQQPSDAKMSQCSQLSSPRSGIMQTVSTARSSQSAKTALSHESSSRKSKVKDSNRRVTSTTRESLSSRTHSDRNSRRLQATKREDAAAVRLLL